MKLNLKPYMRVGAIALAAGAVLGGVSLSAYLGASTSNLSATNLADNCIISTATDAFRAYDPVTSNASGTRDGTGTVTVTCTKGSRAAVTLSQGANADTGSTDAVPLRRMKDSGSDYLSYALYSDSARAAIWGNTTGTGVAHTADGTGTALTVYGRVAPGQNKPAGNYSDTVVVTVNF